MAEDPSEAGKPRTTGVTRRYEREELAVLSEQSAEYPVLHSYFETVFGLPWNERSKDSLSLAKVERLTVKSLRFRSTVGIALVTINMFETVFNEITWDIHGSAPYDILKDVNVRKAIEMGIDRNKYVSGVLNGLATTDQTWVPPAVLGSSAAT